MNDLRAKIEALLFAIGGPLGKQDLAKKLGVSLEDIDTAARAEALGAGIVLVDDGRSLELRAAPHSAELIEAVRKEEYNRDIGRAGLEALAAILYRGPLTRAELDFIRGVNSSQTLRTLAMRGLIRRVSNPRDERSFLYEPTTELLSQLGISHRSELPQYEEVREKLTKLETAYRTHVKEEDEAQEA